MRRRAEPRLLAVAAITAGLLGACVLPPAADPVPIDRRPVAVADPGSMLAAGWHHGAFIEIVVRTWKDSDGDGIGDLRGLAETLPALQQLGIKGIALAPMMRRADDGRGTAATDFRRIEPACGTLADFDVLLREAHARGIAVVMDYAIDAASPEPAPDYHRDSLRFWLNRGVDGLRFEAVTQAAQGVGALMDGYRNRRLFCKTADGCGSSSALGPEHRFIDAARGPLGADDAADRLAEAAALLLPGTPFIHHRGTSFGDPRSLLAHHQALLALRNALPSLAQGRYEAPQVDGRVHAFQRATDDERTLVLVNFGRIAATIPVAGLGARARYASEYPAGGAVSQADADGRLRFALAPQSFRVLKRER